MNDTCKHEWFCWDGGYIRCIECGKKAITVSQLQRPEDSDGGLATKKDIDEAVNKILRFIAPRLPLK